MRYLAISILLLLLVAPPALAAEGGGTMPVYSIQVRAVPLAELEDGMATYRRLRDEGYLAYASRVEISGEPWLRIAVGVFRSRGAAAEFGRAFGAAEGLEHFVAPAPVRVLPAADEREFVVTPSALWVRGSGGVREVFAFDAEAPNGSGLPAAILPVLSSDGRTLAAIYNCRLLVAAIDGDAAVDATDAPGGPCVTTVSDQNYGWRPGWSPSGDYVAFLDQALWEYEIGLWLARSDGGGLLCLACNRHGQSAVRWFVWHPSEDRVLFVEGSSLGTIPVGGGLFTADVDGTIRTIIPADPSVGWEQYEEIAGPLRIEDGFLHFRRVRWLDDNYIETSITEDRLPIGAL